MAHGVGELDLNAPAVPPRNDFVNDECPYLLLDVRDRDEFDQCHIISGCEISFNTLEYILLTVTSINGYIGVT